MNPDQPRPLDDGDVFDAAWRLCVNSGRCDAFGGAEYKRLRRQWDRIVGLGHALCFIAEAANAPPPPPAGKDGVK